MAIPKFRKGLDSNGSQITSVGDPTTPTAAANKQYVDGVARGLDWKAEVIAASTGNVSVASPGGTLDGVTLSASMQSLPALGSVTRVLLKDQTTASENGVYDWNGAGTPLTRSLDSDTGTRLSGSTYTVQRGTVNADRVYRVNTDDTITVGTTSISFGQVGAASQAYTADGNGIELVGTTFSLELDSSSGLIKGPNGLKVDTSVVARYFAASCVAATNPQTFNHGLGKRPAVQVLTSSDGSVTYPDVTVTNTTVTVDWGSAPATGEYEVIAVG